MRLSDHWNIKGLRRVSVVFAFLCGLGFAGVSQFAQQVAQLPARTGHVNDFAGVVDEKTRQQLESILENLKQRSEIQLDLATVESTGSQNIFDFSSRLARDWDVGARGSAKKTLLLVVSVNERTMFTQFSKSVQAELPEGILGEMGQRMRPLLAAGHFSEGLALGVQHFVNALADRIVSGSPDMDQRDVALVNPRGQPVVKKTTDEARSATAPVASITEPREEPARNAKNRSESLAVRSAVSRKSSTPVNDEDEAEEVELTFTLPLDKRVAKLKDFLETHPNSKARPRAIELLVSTHAALGDQRLKNGDSNVGIEELMLAIDAAPVETSEKLFSGVISQIPLNLYLRGERAAALKAAASIEEKFGSDAKRLLSIAGFFLGIERGEEAARVARKAVRLAPELAEAHHALGLALHISLELDDAAAEYKRALELDPNSKGTRRSLADLSRAEGRSEQALALYREQITADQTDKAARAGLVLSLMDLGRLDEANKELTATLQEDPRNLGLLAGAAYWFAAHNNTERALELARKAVEIEPRYTWSQIALARALIAQKVPSEAERAIRFARQYGRFSTLDYELASVLAAAGLYEEAAEALTQSFTLKDGVIETRLAGRVPARATSFSELLAPERRASIFQFLAADTESNAKTLKALLAFTLATTQAPESDKAAESSAVGAANEFASGDDDMRAYRQLYASSRLLRKGIGPQSAYQLAEDARNTVDAALSVPAVTVAVQADEFREIRARAIASGGTPDVPEAPRNVLSNILRGRLEDLSGWALFNQDKTADAIDHLKRAVNILPEGTPSWRTALWHLGAALDQAGSKEEALNYYIKSYNSGEPDPVRRTLIEQLYKTVNGSLEGLDRQIGVAASVSSNLQPSAASSTAPAAAPLESPTPAASTETSVASVRPLIRPSPESPAATLAEKTPTAEASPAATPEGVRASESGSLPTAEPSPIASPQATPAKSLEPSSATAEQSSDSPESLASLARLRAIAKITGRVKDSSNNGLADVVVVLISPRGTVLASTTDAQGNYSFTVSPSQHSYRIIPSKDGFIFEPVDKVLPGLTDDLKELDFIGALRRAP